MKKVKYPKNPTVEDFIKYAHGHMAWVRQRRAEGAAHMRECKRLKQIARGKAHRAARRAERAKSNYCLRPNEKRMLAPLPGWQMLVARMVPGQWYALPDLRGLMPEYAGKSVTAYVGQELREHGLIERALNPDFDRSRNERRQMEPMYLYRLSRISETRRREWLGELGEG